MAYQNNLTKISADMILPKIIKDRNTNIRTYYTREEILKNSEIINTKNFILGLIKVQHKYKKT